MALLGRSEIERALTRLGQLADEAALTLEFMAVGGVAMVLGFEARLSTHDVDAIILPPNEAALVRQFAEVVATELDWPIDWLNDGAKGYLTGQSRGVLLFESRGIRVYRPAIEQLLAMKLSAWRDDIDITDAALLLRLLRENRNRETIWSMVVPYIVPGRELKAQFAIEDLWESEA